MPRPTSRWMASSGRQDTTHIVSQRSRRGDSSSLIASTHATSVPARARASQPVADPIPHGGMDDGLEVGQGGRVAEHGAGQRGRVRRAESGFDRGPGVRVGLADLARDHVGVDGRHSPVVEQGANRALPAADGTGQTDDLHASDSSGNTWQCGQKWVARVLTTIRSMRRPQRKHGSPVRR